MSELGALADGLGDPCSARSSLRSSHGSHTSRSGGGIGSGSLGGGANNNSGGGSRFAFPPSATRSTRGNSLGQADSGYHPSSGHGQGMGTSLEHGIASSEHLQQQPRSFEQMIRSGGSSSKDKSNGVK